MAKEQLVEYIKKSLASGKSEIETINSLREVGWLEAEIQAAQKAYSEQNISPGPSLSVQPPKETQALMPNTSSVGQTTSKALPVFNTKALEARSNTLVSESGKKIWIVFVVIIFTLLFILGGGYFAYQKGIVFARPPFSPEEFLEKSLLGVSGIDNASYQVSMSFSGQPKEANAEAFVYSDGRTDDYKEKYKRDVVLSTCLNILTEGLIFYSEDNGIYPESALKDGCYVNGYNYYDIDYDLEEGDISPEEIRKKITYSRGGDSRSYIIDAVFETKEAVAFIQKNDYLGSLNIEGQKLTISSENGFDFLYLPRELPKPSIVQTLEDLGQMAAYFSRDTNIVAKAKGSGGESEGVRTTETNLSLDASFGDSSYSFAADLITKDKTVYVRLGKFPSLPFLSAFFDPSLIKGKWIEITEEDIQDTLVDLPLAEDIVKEDTLSEEKLIEAYKKMFSIAKEEKLIKVRGLPVKEIINEKPAFRYDLSLNRDSLAVVYKRYVMEVGPLLMPEGEGKEMSLTVDESLMEYLSSEEFKSVYEYLAKNNSLSVWFNREGIPVQAILKSRIVPSESGFDQYMMGYEESSATTSEKSIENQSQFVLELAFSLQNINDKTLPTLPEEFMRFEEAYELLFGQSLIEVRNRAKDMSIKASLSSFRARAEIYYDGKKSYGPLFGLGLCPDKTSKLQNIFTNIENQKILEQITKDSRTNRCASSDQSYAITAALIGDPNTYHCVDSGGSSKTITGKEISEVIVGSGTKTSPYKCAP